MLMQLEEMIALNFTLFTSEEYAQLSTAIASVGQAITDLQKRPKARRCHRVQYDP